MTKFNIGDKVVPLSKSTWGTLEDSNTWRRAQESNQGFLYVNHYESEDVVTCNDELVDYESGDFFKVTDLVPYSENMATVKAQALIGKLEGLIDEAKVTIKALQTTQTEEVKPVAPVNARQKIIDEAKEFVEKYRAVKNGSESHTIGNTTAREHFYEAEFARKGNNITALVYHLAFGKTKQSNKPNRIGKAVCAKDDVFNQYIGEAIALGRALGINVDKFIEAVQPTEKAVGQVVVGNEGLGSFYSPNKKFTLIEKLANGDSFIYEENEDDFIYTYQIGAILDDTNAVYEV